MAFPNRNPDRPRRKLMKNRIPERFRNRPLKPQTLTAMIPNMTTIMAMCCGMTAIRFAIMEKWEFAVIAILIAGLLDAMDGSLARLLNSTSRLGAELDSLSDLLNFGASPALVLYLKGLSAWGEAGWAITLFFTACMALRLARFNVLSAEPKPHWNQDFFLGTPAPAAAFLGLQPIILHLAYPSIAWFNTPLCSALFMLVTGCLMVSRIPTFSIKTVKIPPHLILPFMLLLVCVAGLLYSFPFITLSMIAVIYVGMIPFSIRQFNRLKKEGTSLDDLEAALVSDA
jgi:CDP-diacylglycerol--serine O-phosphatidyltransferase